MIEGTGPPTRDRLVAAAAQLFASNGYGATSVADIQLACGLTAGSGALYKHFSSKRALLEEIVQRHVATMTLGHAEFVATLPDDPRSALHLIVAQVWDAMERDRDLLRVLLRDLDPYPELLDRMWQGVQAHVYGALSAWLTAQRDRSGAPPGDPDATAAVLVASLTCYRILDVLIGRVPGDVPESRFADAWVEQAVAALALPG